MAVYAIGDVQGCYQALLDLLERLEFSADRDTLWFTGDLVNRGPQSAEVVRFVRGLPNAISVLGNHDLHVLAVAGGSAPPGRRDRFDDLLAAPDGDALLDWLRRRPLLHHDPALGYTLVHAGLLPQWDLQLAKALAHEAETALRAPDVAALFGHMYGDQPDRWADGLGGWERLRVIINGFTRLRFCDAEGRMGLGHKGAPGSQPATLLPWFRVPARRNRDLRIVFGHWSTLGLWAGDGVIGLDSGCLWGRTLTAVRLDRGPVFTQVTCTQQQIPSARPATGSGT